MSNKKLGKAINLRHTLHKNPELSGKEVHTTEYLKKILGELDNCKIIEFQHTGLIARFSHQGDGPHILIRGDIDALPIQDKIKKPYKSENNGVGHKCGHDGHTAILYHLALNLNKNIPEQGRIDLLFQPSEENGRGASIIINDKAFTMQPDYIYALHNLPGYDAGTILINRDTFSCSVISCIIQIRGKTSHAAEPDKGISPLPFILDLLTSVKSLEDNNQESENFFLCTPIYMNVGEKDYGISPGDGEIHFTLRCRSNALLDDKKQQLTGLIQELAMRHRAKSALQWLEEFRATENNTQAVEHIEACAEELGFHVIERRNPFPWGEDFGLFTEKFPGAMFGLGAGKESKPLHNEEYDFNDAIIPTGSRLFYTLIHHICT